MHMFIKRSKMVDSPTYHRLRAILHLSTLISLLPISITYICAQLWHNFRNVEAVKKNPSDNHRVDEKADPVNSTIR